MDHDPELARLRDRIDDINQRLLDVLHERAQVVRRIGIHKLAAGMAIIDTEREQAMLTRMLQNAPADGFSASALQRILRSVFEASREIVAAP